MKLKERILEILTEKQSVAFPSLCVLLGEAVKTGARSRPNSRVKRAIRELQKEGKATLVSRLPCAAFGYLDQLEVVLGEVEVPPIVRPAPKPPTKQERIWIGTGKGVTAEQAICLYLQRQESADLWKLLKIPEVPKDGGVAIVDRLVEKGDLVRIGRSRFALGRAIAV